jgi:AraC-like DNA-binding protein
VNLRGTLGDLAFPFIGSDLPIKHIAQQAGFKTVQYLTRAFHRMTGDTPAAFRRRSSRVSEFQTR